MSRNGKLNTYKHKKTQNTDLKTQTHLAPPQKFTEAVKM